MPNSHLVILKKPYLDMILDGSKPIESRLTKVPCPPYNCIFRGDKLFFKVSSGPVCATAQVSAVKQFGNLTPAKIIDIKAEYNDRICGADEYWQLKSDSKYAVLVWVKNIKLIKPVMIDKKDWRAWVLLKKPNDFGLLDLSASADVVQKAY